MFIYNDNGMVSGYQPTGDYPEHIAQAISSHMMEWYRGLGGQSRVRLAKVAVMEHPNTHVNLKRIENE